MNKYRVTAIVTSNIETDLQAETADEAIYKVKQWHRNKEIVLKGETVSDIVATFIPHDAEYSHEPNPPIRHDLPLDTALHKKGV